VRALTVLLATLLLALAGCGGGDDESSDATSPEAMACEDADTPNARDPGALEAPTEPLPADTTYSLTFVTNCGNFTVELDTELAPNTSASLVALAEDGYFDDTIFHRVVPGFVIQGGDPTQTGAGGPGYSTVDVPPSDASYTQGVVAMAKTDVEPPGTAGSQFFVVSGPDAATLPPDYAIVGEVTEGMDAVERIDAVGASQTVVVESVAVTTS
jgi:peptidyl-prolyl cis-trans isomerase B (cyclophilin B)